MAQSPSEPYSPLTPAERWRLWETDNFTGSYAYFRALGSASGLQVAGDPAEWKGFSGYAKRAASQFAGFAIQGSIQSSLAAAVGYDTRYAPSHRTGFFARSGHAISRTFVTTNAEGKSRLDAPNLAGIYGAAMIQTLWYPARYNWKDGLRNGNINVGFDAGINLLREFGPDIKRAFRGK